MNEESNHNNNNGRVAAVMGSSKGIGKAIAMEFAKAGYSIIINARNEEELKLATEDIYNLLKIVKRFSTPILGGISQEHVCKSLIENAIKQFGRIDEFYFYKRRLM